MLHLIILAVLQGVTEFLPVSSSGHLILLPYLMNWSYQGIAMDIGLHLGTLAAVCVYFFGDLLSVLKGVFKKGAGRQLFFLLLIGTAPILILGLFAADKIEQSLRSPLIIAFMLIFFGVLLWGADKFGQSRKTIAKMTMLDALVIGSAQCLALIPGVSRSGITMTAARFCGVKRPEAARFAMLLSVPAIGAAGAWLLLKLVLSGDLAVLNAEFFYAMLFSFISGLAVICFLMKWVQKHSFFAFMIYRIALGLVIMGLVLFK